MVLAGWDGLIDQAQGAAYVPAGASRWEIGTNQDAPGKVKSDFEKRNAPPAPPKKRGPAGAGRASASQAPPPPAVSADPLDRTQTTLVFVVGRD